MLLPPAGTAMVEADLTTGDLKTDNRKKRRRVSTMVQDGVAKKEVRALFFTEKVALIVLTNVREIALPTIHVIEMEKENLVMREEMILGMMISKD
jgi:hypothetical protein